MPHLEPHEPAPSAVIPRGECDDWLISQVDIDQELAAYLERYPDEATLLSEPMRLLTQGGCTSRHDYPMHVTVGALLIRAGTESIGIGSTITVGFAVSRLAQVPLLFAGPGLQITEPRNYRKRRHGQRKTRWRADAGKASKNADERKESSPAPTPQLTSGLNTMEPDAERVLSLQRTW
ncbi:hypothetical protein [Streptomyces sp. NPDC001933]|uniref:hypothetical protein n=1 Tax=Streptomyces sp. NPDC001933 TaxID=3364626 RepID=UPI00369EF69F